MSSHIKDIQIYKKCTMRDALKKMDEVAKGILLVVDENEKLLGSLTDGDIRRALLNGLLIDDKVEKFFHLNPITANINMTKEEIKELFIKKAIKQLPLLNEAGVVVDLLSINDLLIEEGKENYVIIMAGGLGTRLKDLTKEVPKPMLTVGQTPILQHIIKNFKRYGYNKIILSVNYKAEVIENYFQDGYAHGVKIKYIKEKKRLGTGGGIKLANDYINKPFFVINGDIFTNLNFENMMNYHLENGFDFTLGTKKHSFQIPYGVIDTRGKEVSAILEKPQTEYLINGGVYCANPNVVKFIPEDEYFDMTDLINKCIENNLKVGFYEIQEYWMDIGQMSDYVKINEEFDTILF